MQGGVIWCLRMRQLVPLWPLKGGAPCRRRLGLPSGLRTDWVTGANSLACGGLFGACQQMLFAGPLLDGFENERLHKGL